MRVLVPFLIVRKYDEVIVAEPLQDEYTRLQLLIPYDKLTKDEINILVKCNYMTKGNDGLFSIEQEAENFNINHSWIKCGIEYIGVDVL